MNQCHHSSSCKDATTKYGREGREGRRISASILWSSGSDIILPRRMGRNLRWIETGHMPQKGVHEYFMSDDMLSL
jgi:hypothetical protein